MVLDRPEESTRASAHSLSISPLVRKRYGSSSTISMPKCASSSRIIDIRCGCVVLVLKLPRREFVRGTFREISPFSGTINRSAPIPLATATPSPRNMIERPRVVVSDSCVDPVGGDTQSRRKGVSASSYFVRSTARAAV